MECNGEQMGCEGNREMKKPKEISGKKERSQSGV
jgi:hypothetical protein